MAKRKWSEIKAATMSPESQERAARKAETLLAAMELDELARRRGFTQEQLAERLGRAQGNVSRLLRREDMHVSSLRSVVEAMGGELELVARFPDADVKLNQFR